MYIACRLNLSHHRSLHSLYTTELKYTSIPINLNLRKDIKIGSNLPPKCFSKIGPCFIAVTSGENGIRCSGGKLNFFSTFGSSNLLIQIEIEVENGRMQQGLPDRKTCCEPRSSFHHVIPLWPERVVVVPLCVHTAHTTGTAQRFLSFSSSPEIQP